MSASNGSEGTPESGGPRRCGWVLPVAVLVGALAVLCLVWLGSQLASLGSDTAYGPRLTDGWVELPSGVDVSTVRVIASRDGRHTRVTTPAPDGRFRIVVHVGGAFDLHVSDWVSWRDPYPFDGSAPAPEPTHVIEGGLRDVPWGARNVRVPLARVALVDTNVRVLGTDGVPVSGEWVYLQSHGDRVEQKTDAEGLARFKRLPPRLWRATASAPGDASYALLTGWTDFVPSEQEVRIHIPEGVEVRVRLGEGVRANFLNGCEVPHVRNLYVDFPWRPGTDGTMRLWVSPDLATLALRAVQRDRIDESTTEERTVAAGAVAVRNGAVLLLEPLGR